MNLIDSITLERIINPYVEIISIGDRLAARINTRYFTERAQDNLIKERDFSKMEERLYEVWAVVGGTNPSKTVYYSIPEISRIFLGYLMDSRLKEELPEVSKFFAGKRNT